LQHCSADAREGGKEDAMLRDGHVTVMVKDLERAIGFYTTQLGLSLKLHVPGKWAEVQGAGLTIGLHGSAGPGKAPAPDSGAGHVSIGFTVDRLDTAMPELNARGIQFGPHVSSDGPVKLAFFSDPDGTPLYLCELTPEASSSTVMAGSGEERGFKR
jgi:catechol 2,3-dioxygenase-like lactoylglutathione lyase family enzyme